MTEILIAQSLISGILFGGIFGIIAMGLTLTWGLLRIANFAHLSFTLLAAYCTYSLIASAGMDPLLTLLVTLPAFFLLGMLVQWFFMAFKVTTFTSLLLTFGMFIVLENIVALLWSADQISARQLIAQHYKSAIRLPEPLNRLSVAPPDLLAFIAAVLLAVAITLLLRRTQWGRAVRAMAQDRVVAGAFGIDYWRNALLLSGVATATAAVAGVFVAMKFPIYPSLPTLWIGKVVAAVILGGLGNPVGAVIAACGLNAVEALWSAFLPPSMAPLVSFSVLIAVLFIQPGALYRGWQQRRRLAALAAMTDAPLRAKEAA